ncbi:hypothetical protein [Bordetella genomosp. 11]|uniref:Uncharacterized protein n=1 Tax=Bordetella genomosp. 11 TaxID=1416808 RepID=A0A261UWU1_9BORD|nr:hypothetical protein [Bordetella genomosp. 11]OZI66344.1 hypothetical protein CAL28_00935 [Bordetella genomosp. 11]
MTKVMTAVLALALLAAPLAGYAEDTTSNQPQIATTPPAQNYSSWCGSAATGTTYSGVVVGIGANWWGTNKFPFSVTNDKGSYTESGMWTFDTVQGKLMMNVLMMSYVTGDSIVMYCDSKTVTSVWVGRVGAP